MQMRPLQVLTWVSYSLALIVLGAAGLEGMVYVPNWIHDVPRSLEITRSFLAVRNPGNFFQLVYPLMLLTLIAAAVAARRHAAIRNRLVSGLILFVIAEAMTFVMVYPQIGVLLSENVSAIPRADLDLAVRAYVVWGFWVRVPMMALAAVALIFPAALQALNVTED